MENTIVKIESSQIEEVVKNSGLAIQEGDEIKKSYIPFVEQLSEIQAQASKINFENPQPIDETIARELRLKTVKIRTGASDLKDERKRIYLLRGNLEQASYNLIAASCKLTEEVFVNVEKAREIAENKRKELLKAERIEKLLPYDVNVEFIDLANMPDEFFTKLLNDSKKGYEDRIAAEKKAEEDRLAKIEAERIENERIRKENERLQKENEAKERQLQFERQQAEKLAEIERKKQADILKAQQEKADKERKENEAKLEAERKEKQILEDELKAKKDAEESDRKAKELAEKKAQAAPDKDKLSNAINSMEWPQLNLTTEQSKMIEQFIIEKFTGFKKWAAIEINKL